jgi:hypothetical protein
MLPAADGDAADADLPSATLPCAARFLQGAMPEGIWARAPLMWSAMEPLLVSCCTTRVRANANISPTLGRWYGSSRTTAFSQRAR